MRYVSPAAKPSSAPLTPLGCLREGRRPVSPITSTLLALCRPCLVLPATLPCRASSPCGSDRADNHLGHVPHVLLFPFMERLFIALTTVAVPSQAAP